MSPLFMVEIVSALLAVIGFILWKCGRKHNAKFSSSAEDIGATVLVAPHAVSTERVRPELLWKGEDKTRSEWKWHGNVRPETRRGGKAGLGTDLTRNRLERSGVDSMRNGFAPKRTDTAQRR